MRILAFRFTWTGLGVGLLVASGAAVFAGCSGSDDDDLFGSPTTNGGDAGTPTDDDGTTKPGPSDGDGDGTDDVVDDEPGKDEPDAEDSPSDTGALDGGNGATDGGEASDGGATTKLASTPGKVPCGDKECDAPGNVCCSSTSLCLAAGLVDEKYCLPVACDEAADCGDGQSCCLDNGKRPQSYCASTCRFGDTKLCQSNEECGGSTCQTYTCPGFGARPFNACSQPIFCSP